jgi:hypothetical protein
MFEAVGWWVQAQCGAYRIVLHTQPGMCLIMQLCRVSGPEPQGAWLSPQNDSLQKLVQQMHLVVSLSAVSAWYAPHWPGMLRLGLSHLQAVELADQDGLALIILTAQLVDLLQAVRQVLPAALCVGASRHCTTGLAGCCAAGTTAG